MPMEIHEDKIIMRAGKYDLPKSWMVFNVGCIECGVSSNVVGLYATEEEAKQIAKTCEDQLHWREGGQNVFGVFDLRAPQAQEYTDVIANVKDKP